MGLFGRRKNEIISPTQAPNMATLNGVPMRVKGASATVSSPAAATAASRATEPAFALPVEDVFIIRDRGAVVTGTVASGVVRQGGAIVLRQGVRGARGVISGIEVNHRQTDEAHAGSAVSILVRGLKEGDIRAGDVLASRR